MNSISVFHVEQMLVILCAASTSLVGGAELLSVKEKADTPPLPCPAPFADELVLATDSTEVSQYINQGILDTLMGYHTRARAYINKALEKEPDSLITLCTQLLLEENDISSRKKQLNAIEKIIMSNQNVFLTPPELFYVETFLQLANGDISGAAEAFEKRAQQYKADVLSSCWAANLYHYAIPAHISGADIAQHPYQKKALDIISETLRKNPQHPIVHYVRAAIEENATEISNDAIQSASFAALHLQNSSIAHHLHGHLLYKRGDYQAAASAFKKALACAQQDCASFHVEAHHSFELLASQLYLTTASLHSGVSWNKVIKPLLTSTNHGKHFSMITRGEILYRWEVRTLPMRSLIMRPKEPSADEIKKVKELAIADKGTLDDDIVYDFSQCLIGVLQVRHLVAAKRFAAAEQALENAQQAYQRLIVPRETYARQSVSYKICFKRAVDCADIAINVAKKELYRDTADIWNEKIQQIIQGQPHLLPPIVPQYPLH